MAEKIKTVVYGKGGYDESKPNNNVVETMYYTDEEWAVVQAEINKAQARQALLDKLGITEDEAKLLLGGN
jgi:hypothetical protein